MTAAPVQIEAVAPAGRFVGTRGGGVDRYLGIRYAEPPTGDRRFRAPSPHAADAGPIDATVYGNRAHQVGLAITELFPNIEVYGAEQEDCLFLNVFARSGDTDGKPVVVWIHGGAFINGCSNDYDPSVLVAQHDLVVVTINYRLGVFGFLDLSSLGEEFAGSANLGIQDQVAALRWVHDNIAAFGGDATNVTIWGESAGAASVMALLGTPSAEGLFHRAVAFSGSETLTPPMDQLPLLSPHLGTDSPEAALDQLMAMPAAELSELQVASGFYTGTSLDGVVITRPACEAIVDGGAASVPIIAGATRDEGTFLAPAFALSDDIVMAMLFGLAASTGRDDGTAYRAFLDREIGLGKPLECLTRAWFDLFRASALRVAATASMHGAGGWVYDFDVETEHELGTTHGSDVPFTFNWVSLGADMEFVHPATPENRRLAEHWSATLVEFARSGSPSDRGLPEWPRYEPAAFPSLRLQHEPAVVERTDGAMLDIYRVPGV